MIKILLINLFDLSDILQIIRKTLKKNLKISLFDEDDIKIKPASNTFLEEKNLEFCISPTKQKIKKKTFINVIVDNFYALLINNEYNSLRRYFIFKDLII